MNIVEISCANCGQQIIVGDEYLREQMFCTLGCMNQFEEKLGHMNQFKAKEKLEYSI
jgi:hypothetical protein